MSNFQIFTKKWEKAKAKKTQKATLADAAIWQYNLLVIVCHLL
jgi:hypothetical protein